MSDFGKRAREWMRGFFEVDFAAISTLLLPCMLLWLGTHNRVTLPEIAWKVERCENASYNWVGGVRVCNSVDRREGVSDDYDGGRLRK